MIRPPNAADFASAPLYDPAYEHDACGTGFLAHLSGIPSHAIVRQALEAVVNLTHRGAVAADARTGDGAGVTLQTPGRLLAREVTRLTGRRVPEADLAAGMVFFPQDPAAARLCEDALDAALSRGGVPVLAWRDVPVDPAALGATARASMPAIRQVIVGRPEGDDADFERALYLARRRAEAAIGEAGIRDFHVASFSSRTIVYKGLFVARDLGQFYLDLTDPETESALAVFHQRYSTNTFPTWFLAQPFRRIAHNGEINTLQGNRNWMRAREPELSGGPWGDALADLLPVIDPTGSDSLSLDNVLELLELSGRDLLHAIAILVPEPWERMPHMPADLRAFYAWHAGLMEPWDGPAALAFTDGRIAGATLDRNGLRPARYSVSAGGLVVAASETGVLDLSGEEIVERGRLGPGQMLAVDVMTGTLWRNAEIKADLAARQPWREWVGAGETPPAGRTIRVPTEGAPPAGGRAYGNTPLQDRSESQSGRALPTPGPNVQQHPNTFTTHASPVGAYGHTPGRPQAASTAPGAALLTAQITFGFSAEDQRLVIQPMAAEGIEPLWSMGDDAPLAVLSRFRRPLAAFFRQRFAQVTNPPIDSLREALVMSLDVYLGPRASLLAPILGPTPVMHLSSPVLLADDLAALYQHGAATLDATFPTTFGEHAMPTSSPGVGADRGVRPRPEGRHARPDVARPDRGGRTPRSAPTAGGEDASTVASSDALAAAIERLTTEARAAVAEGAPLLVLSDRVITAERAPIPMALAVGAVHHALIVAGSRMRASLMCDSGDIWDAHQAAVLIGYGASALHPWLALETAASVAGTRGLEETSAETLRARYQHSLEYGLLKIMSKMGISALSSYTGGQLFEIIGLDPSVVARCFSGTPARLGGLTFAGIAARVLERHAAAWVTPPSRLPDIGAVRFRRDGEYHAWSPTTVKALQQSVESGVAVDYEAYRAVIEEREPAVVRDLLAFRPTTPIPLDEVEPAESIRLRFVITAMSLGALSPEAYRTLAIAMNRIGGRSNSGEGGEDPDWYHEGSDDIAHGAVKQIASGRFGVTAEYLARATEIEIKMAQGSKPGEGGQLPGHKVTPFIARLRHAVPGSPLISPPPHHDIYSIEDLAQLIYDLKQVNPRARVGVKLVAEAGVGTIAAGVAKAHADYILISGHSGGTGASPLSSIKYAGVPWELGLAETQQTLVLNGLRERVRLRTDGGLQTGRDIVIAALFGAEEFGLGTSALVAIGCDMARQCHLNSCPTGIATQREDLRAKFKGTPEQVIAWVTSLAEDVRSHLAALGARTLDEVTGRVDLLEQIPDMPGPAGLLDLSSLLSLPGHGELPLRSTVARNDFADVAGDALDTSLLPDVLPAITSGHGVALTAAVRNHHRAAGARIAGEIAIRRGRAPLSDGAVRLHLTGVAGQSFGAWCTQGMRLVLDGEANDYVGKGMSGGEIIIRRPAHETAPADHTRPQVIIGNTVLYGATGGELYAAGQAGERFAVRNSGALAVVEGVGDHGCEYMTGGAVVVLGPAGRNFAAGMTNGVAWVLDPDNCLPERYNPGAVTLARVTEDAARLHALIRRHVEWTGSARGRAVLERWNEMLPHFWQVSPKEVAVPIVAERVRRGRVEVAAD